MHSSLLIYVKVTFGHILCHSSISEDESNMDQDIGYCPQFDALDSMLTGEETLYFYSRIKGIPEEDIPKVHAYIYSINIISFTQTYSIT